MMAGKESITRVGRTTSGCAFDHLTLIANDLRAGSALVSSRLGVVPPPGGKHPRMGTHNLLLRLGDTAFLEVIAIDPEANSPARPRWFGLDELDGTEDPFLGGWVLRTDDIATSLTRSPLSLGSPEPISRGTLSWTISIPEDGSRPLDGAAPAFIQWNADVHPAQNMQDLGCRLVKLEVHHPKARQISALTDKVGYQDPSVEIDFLYAGAPKLVAHIQTPHGLRTLS